MYIIIFTISIGGLLGGPAPLHFAVIGYMITAILTSTLTAFIPKIWTKLLLKFTLSYKRAYVIAILAWIPSGIIGLLVHNATAGGRDMRHFGDPRSLVVIIGEILIISGIFWKMAEHPEKRSMAKWKALIGGLVLFIGSLIIGFGFGTTLTSEILSAFI